MQPHRVLVVGYHAAEVLDIACVVSALQLANQVHGRAVYSVQLASPGGGTIETGTGLRLVADRVLERTRGPFDTLVVSGGIGYVDAMDDPVLVAHVRRLARDARRVASVCTGAGILAAAGLLDGRRAATHWDHVQSLAQRFPQVCWDPAPIFVVDDRVCTSAGVTAGLDLTLSFVEDDAGPQVAREVARQLVTYMQRPGNQAQMSMFTASPPASSSVVRGTVDHIKAQLDADLTTASLASRAGVSERHLTRLFLRELGVPPGRFVRRARCEAAAHLLATSDLTIEVIAGRCGFGTDETLRQAFQRSYGVSPSHYRLTHSTTRRGLRASG